MSVSIRLSDDEEDALRGLRLDARLLYLMGIRPFMDYSTGIVGVKRIVCYKGFRELLEVAPDRGSRLGAVSAPSKSLVRNLLVLLERHGLVEKIPQRRRVDAMVFKLPLAIVDEKIRSGEQRHISVIGGSRKAATQKNNDKSNVKQFVRRGEEDSTDTDDQRINNCEQRHTSVLPLSTTTTKNISSANGGKLLAADWLPAVDTMTRLVRDEFVDAQFVEEYTAEFVMFWTESGVAKASWDAVFFRQCLDQWKLRRFSWRQR